MSNNKSKKHNYYKNHNGHNNGNKFYYKKNKTNNKNKCFYYHKNKQRNNKPQIILDNEAINNENKVEEVNNNILINQEPEVEKTIDKKDLEIKQDVEIEDIFEKENIENAIKVSLQEEPELDEFEFRPIKKIETPKYQRQGKLKYVIGVLIVIAAVFGVSYSFFTYSKEDSRTADIASGEVYVKIEEQTVNLTLNRMYPRTAEEARTRSDNYIDFTVKAKNTSETKEINYVLNISNGDDVSGKTRINPQYLMIDLQEKVGNEYQFVKNAVPLSTFSFNDVVPVNTTSEITKEYRLRIWISDSIIISDTESNATYTQAQFNNLYANVHVTVNSGDRDKTLTGEEKVREAITAKINATTNSCNPVWIDDNGTSNDTSDDITYFSGPKACVDMNYVWYSGKLWRITAIYPDGTMKLVTEDNITSIFWGSNTEYDGSWVYQWLNEDFYDTLYNANNIIENGTWNYSTDANDTPVRPETIETQKIKTAPVGLLNAYEYYNSYRCIGSSACTGSSYSTGYLNIGYWWWLITPYSASDVRCVSYYGNLNSNPSSSSAFGVRPSINLKSGLEFTGDGSKSSPYIIKEDKEDVINNTTLLSDRSIGEYVEFDNDLYRIVDTSSGITKLTRVDYLRESGTVITKNLSSTVYFGKSTNTGSDTYWDYYLNNTWYNSISSTYKNMLVDGTYYLGLYPSNTNYKATICKDADLSSVITKTCTKYTSTDTGKTWTGKVGLPRLGEMFSSQLGSGYSTSSDMWTVTPYSTSGMRYVDKYGILSVDLPSSYALGVHPSITLKSGIKITGGTGYVGGDVNSPFEISE